MENTNTTEAKKSAIVAPDMDRVMDMINGDESGGFCLACGEEAYGIEPDARRYECESCGAKKVYGAEELLIMLGGC